MSKKTVTLALLSLVLVFVLLLLADCTSNNGSCSGNSGGDCFDGQSHWLTACFTSQECGPYECICGICGVACDSSHPCDVSGRNTACVASRTSSVLALCGELQPEADLCLEGCSDDTDCGNEEKCLDGSCIPVLLADSYVPVDPCARGTFDGDAVIRTAEDLAKLEGHSSIAGDLAVFYTDLGSLEGIECLTSVGGGLWIEGNENLDSLKELANLESIMGIMGSDTYNDTFDVNKSVAIEIRSNPLLTDLQGLNRISAVVGSVSIGYNDGLSTLEGLNGLTSIDGDLNIDGNVALKSFAGLESLSEVTGSFTIHGDPPYPEQGWVMLDELIGLQELRTVGADFQIYRTGLSSLSELANLRSVGGALGIQENDLLANLDGLVNLTTVGGSVGIIGNVALSNLDGLENLETVGGGIGIRGNAVLPECQATSFVDGLLGYSGEISICENLSDDCGESEPCP